MSTETTPADPLDQVARYIDGTTAGSATLTAGGLNGRFVPVEAAQRIRDEAAITAFGQGRQHGHDRTVEALAARMRADSEHWFPALHTGARSDVPLFMHYALGLIGEAGEVANVVKKLNRDGYTADRYADLGAELADVLIYLLLLADEVDIDIVEAYRAKRQRNIERWGAPS
jgi:NTP pyrophosphatase (non-canonical NTP hydrolase)